MKEFIIIFRECLEAGLIVGIIYTFIHVNQIKGQKRNIWLGVLGGIVASILVGCVFFFLGGNIPTEYEKLFEGVSMYITALFLFYVIFWLSKRVSDKSLIQNSVQESISKNESWGLFILILFAILREGFEIIILLFKEIKNGDLNYLGVSSGVILAVVIIYLIFALGKKIPIRQFFAYTTLLLVFIAAGLIAYGTHEIEEYIVDSRIAKINKEWEEWDLNSSMYLSKIKEKKPDNINEMTQDEVRNFYDSLIEYQQMIESKIDFSKSKGYPYNKDKNLFSSDYQIARVWNILSPISQDETLNKELNGYTLKIKNYENGYKESKFYHHFHDKGKVGDFLKGFFGYNSNPNYVEFFLWLFFLIFGIKKWADFYYLAPPKK